MSPTKRRSTPTEEEKVAQRILVSACFRILPADYGILCHRGRGSAEKSALRLLPSSFTKTSLYFCYKDKWKEMPEGILEVRTDIIGSLEPIRCNLFVWYWKKDTTILHITTLGSEFCELCTTLKNIIDAPKRMDPHCSQARMQLKKN